MARDLRQARIRRRDERELLASLPPWAFSDSERAAALDVLAQFSPRYRNLDNHAVLASVRGRFEANVVPEDIFYIAIHRALNPPARLPAIGDKNRYDRLGLPFQLPGTVGRIVRGRLVDPDFRATSLSDLARCVSENGDGEVVLKRALGGSGGKEVRFLTVDELPTVLTPLLRHRGLYEDWILQRPVRQCDALAAFNQSSVNTLRVMTYRSSEGVRHLSSFFRMGRAGQRVDNMSSGGLSCGVDPETGTLRRYGRVYESLHAPVEHHPDSGIAFEGFCVPSWEEVLAACTRGHESIPALDLISWDIAVDEDGRPTFIEFNIVEQDIRVHQVENGPFPESVVAEWAQRIDIWAPGSIVVRKPRRE